MFFILVAVDVKPEVDSQATALGKKNGGEGLKKESEVVEQYWTFIRVVLLNKCQI